MKKIVYLLLGFCMAMTMTACSGQDVNPQVHDPTKQPDSQDRIPETTWKQEDRTELPRSTNVTLPDTDPWNEEVDIWGIPVSVTDTDTEDAAVGFTCCIPEESYIREGEGYVAIKTPDSQVIVMAMTDASYAQDYDPDEAFEGYLDSFEEHLTAFLVHNASDYEMTVVEQEELDVNGKWMVKVRGTMTFTENGRNSRNWVFLGYTAEMQDGRYALWFASHSSGDGYVELKRVSENMANSYEEVAA